MTPQKHFSMVREFHLADFFTLANGACGIAGVFCAMKYLETQTVRYFLIAAALAPAAFIFDVLDGRIARWRQTHSALGRELDSLADVISFGVAPAALAFAAGLNGGWDWVALTYFVCCGVGRLARFNVTAEKLAEGSDSGKVKYFEGTPDSHERRPHRRACVRSVARATRQQRVLGRLDDRTVGIAPARAAVRPVRNADDQQDAAHSEAVTEVQHHSRRGAPYERISNGLHSRLKPRKRS